MAVGPVVACMAFRPRQTFDYKAAAGIVFLYSSLY